MQALLCAFPFWAPPSVRRAGGSGLGTLQGNKAMQLEAQTTPQGGQGGAGLPLHCGNLPGTLRGLRGRGSLQLLGGLHARG